MAGRLSSTAGAAAMALVAALLWAGYYPLVLAGATGTAPGAVVVVPFAVGGIAFALAAVAAGHGAALRELLGRRDSYARGALLAAMQLAILAATYLVGAVDTSLLSLVGDVVITPPLLLLLYRIGGERLRSPAFVLGVSACATGSALTIVAGGGARGIGGAAIPLALAVPFAIALYFLAMARASLLRPTEAVGAHATLVAALVALLASPLLPGGWPGLLALSPGPALALVVIGLTSFFLAPWLYFAAIARAGLVLPAVLMAAIPLFTLLLSAEVLGTTPTLLGLAGIPIAVVGAVVALRGEHAPMPMPLEAGERPSPDR